MVVSISELERVVSASVPTTRLPSTQDRNAAGNHLHTTRRDGVPIDQGSIIKDHDLSFPVNS